ncbi:hypothetical protein [Mucilaginibacter sp. CSA2-8R]|uniref:hypothetical protein n=1 Tax=Mucilaginibacter sp. CSA2-8R TaxID=3141542 RepID=UPI00315DDFA2
MNISPINIKTFIPENVSSIHTFNKHIPFYKGFGVVMLNGRFGVIDRSGNYVVPLKQRVFAIRPWWIEFISSSFEYTYFGFGKGLLGKEPYYDDGEPVTPSLIAKKQVAV